MKKYIVVFAVTVVLILAISILIPRMANSSPEKVFDKYIKFQRVKDYKKAYKGCFSSGYRKRISFSNFEKIQNEITAALGLVLDKQIIQAQLPKGEKKGSYLIIAHGFYPTGVFPEDYFLIKELKGWKIHGFNIQSPLLNPAEQKRMQDFIKGLPEEVRESYLRMFNFQGRPAK